MTTGGEYDIAGLLEREGAIGALVQIPSKEGLLFGELAASVHVSQTTLSNILDTALDADLLVETAHPDDHGNAKRYKLTRRGRHLQSQMKSIGLDEWYQDFLTARRNIEDGKLELREWLDESDITKKRWPPDPDFPHSK